MPFRILVALLVAAAIGAGAYYFLRSRFQPPPFPPQSARPEAPRGTQPRFPIEAPQTPLPKLGQSDPAMREALSGFFDAKALEKFFNLEDAVRRIVATVDNLPRETVAGRLNPVKPIGGPLVTTGKDETLAIGPRNAARYEPFVRLAEGIDAKKAVGVYVHFYPLFQEAYVELGYPTGYFNDRLVEVIDYLLETPEVEGPIKLVTPHVLYEFADPDLESLSAGRKLLVRMGNANAARLKAKLKDVRSALVASAARAPGAQEPGVAPKADSSSSMKPR